LLHTWAFPPHQDSSRKKYNDPHHFLGLLPFRAGPTAFDSDLGHLPSARCAAGTRIYKKSKRVTDLFSPERRRATVADIVHADGARKMPGGVFKIVHPD
jgi:hypothetical protein